MTQWGLDTLFNPGKRHMDEEKRRLQSTREEIGDSSGGKRIDLESGVVRITRKNSENDENSANEENSENDEHDEAEAANAEVENAETDDRGTDQPDAEPTAPANQSAADRAR